MSDKQTDFETIMRKHLKFQRLSDEECHALIDMVRELRDSKADMLANAIHDKDRITELEGVIAGLRSCLKITIEWADNWDSPFMEDTEWTGHDYPRIKAILKQSELQEQNDE